MTDQLATELLEVVPDDEASITITSKIQPLAFDDPKIEPRYRVMAAHLPEADSFLDCVLITSIDFADQEKRVGLAKPATDNVFPDRLVLDIDDGSIDRAAIPAVFEATLIMLRESQILRPVMSGEVILEIHAGHCDPDVARSIGGLAAEFPNITTEYSSSPQPDYPLAA